MLRPPGPSCRLSAPRGQGGAGPLRPPARSPPWASRIRVSRLRTTPTSGSTDDARRPPVSDGRRRRREQSGEGWAGEGGRGAASARPGLASQGEKGIWRVRGKISRTDPSVSPNLCGEQVAAEPLALESGPDFLFSVCPDFSGRADLCLQTPIEVWMGRGSGGWLGCCSRGGPGGALGSGFDPAEAGPR